MDVTKENFKQEVLEAKLPVLVDFWASWCSPCMAVAPLVDKIALENEGKLKVGKVNTDENPDVAANYGILGIPTLILFKNGQEVGRVIGFNPGSIQELVKKGMA
ncbi:MAG: thioredoxin [Candidatus Margulisbacteria bacterium]|nr:thioredoxin [Candidatus Margulisiibacteriota bacterium]